MFATQKNMDQVNKSATLDGAISAGARSSSANAMNKSTIVLESQKNAEQETLTMMLKTLQN